jgi:hypothetical protein
MRRPQRPLKIPRFSHSRSAFAFVEAVALCEMEHGVAQEPICFGLNVIINYRFAGEADA